MNIDMNNIRKQAAYNLDRVIKILNAGILSEGEFACGYINEKQITGDVIVNKSDLEKPIENLRSNIWSLLCIYEENDPSFKVVYEDVENSGGLARFNEND